MATRPVGVTIRSAVGNPLHIVSDLGRLLRRSFHDFDCDVLPPVFSGPDLRLSVVSDLEILLRVVSGGIQAVGCPPCLLCPLEYCSLQNLHLGVAACYLKN